MKLFLVLCVIAAANAEAHWDESGQYRIIDTEPVKVLEPEVVTLNEPAKLRIIADPGKFLEPEAIGKYRIIDTGSVKVLEPEVQLDESAKIQIIKTNPVKELKVKLDDFKFPLYNYAYRYPSLTYPVLNPAMGKIVVQGAVPFHFDYKQIKK